MYQHFSRLLAHNKFKTLSCSWCTPVSHFNWRLYHCDAPASSWMMSGVPTHPCGWEMFLTDVLVRQNRQPSVDAIDAVPQQLLPKRFPHVAPNWKQQTFSSKTFLEDVAYRCFGLVLVRRKEQTAFSGCLVIVSTALPKRLPRVSSTSRGS